MKDFECIILIVIILIIIFFIFNYGDNGDNYNEFIKLLHKPNNIKEHKWFSYDD